MGIVAELRVDPERFLLEEVIAAEPRTELEIIRGAVCGDVISPFLWAEGEKNRELSRAIESEDGVGGVTCISGQDGDGSLARGRLFRIDWNGTDLPLLRAIADENGAVLRASYPGSGRWRLGVLLPDRSSLAAIHEDDAIGFDLRRVSGSHRTHEGPAYGLTEEQREALVAAYRSGYFEIPRDQTLSEVAEELGISANALSARLRRAFRSLVASTLVEDA